MRRLASQLPGVPFRARTLHAGGSTPKPLGSRGNRCLHAGSVYNFAGFRALLEEASVTHQRCHRGSKRVSPIFDNLAKIDSFCVFLGFSGIAPDTRKSRQWTVSGPESALPCASMARWNSSVPSSRTKRSSRLSASSSACFSAAGRPTAWHTPSVKAERSIV